MDLRRLSSFLAVAEEGHFGRAAARLFLSPPAVTAHIQQLERELGVPLFERSPVCLTPAGHRFLGHARSLVEATNAALEDLSAFAADANVLRVGVMGHGSAELTPAVIAAFRHLRPHVELRLEALTFTQHTSALLEHRVDVAFVRPAVTDDRITVDVLTTEARIVVIPARSELAAAGELRLADVLDLPFVALPPHTPRPFTDYLYFTEARGGEAPRPGPDSAVTPQEVLMSAAAGRGAGSALHSFARFYRWPGTLCVPVVDAPWDHSVLATRTGDRNPDVTLFRRLALALAPRFASGAGPGGAHPLGGQQDHGDQGEHHADARPAAGRTVGHR
ncbi:LysR family transcriptional regulator [Amycolatopsis thermophila]|uniref:DNA-binding transcriptional LysR family regulator n=1 Tax=Amycolatopsis thermophila TaxID=206084 RepID=A0ABU0EYR6_9PSEU|nr:LysR family transcriptional regulator [Amycolatopsis thermophila]MDQ0380005.1 DNA-binding transcriptional LysR family regulator [Amycolatopsis thermophila]